MNIPLKPNDGSEAAGRSEMTESELVSAFSDPSSERTTVEVAAALPPHTHVDRSEGLQSVLRALDAAPLIGIDVETTGLNPRHERLRIISVATATGCWVVDVETVDPAPLLDLLRSKRLVGHFIGFDLAFLAQRGFETDDAQDTLFLDHLLHSGEPNIRHSLAEAARRHTGVELSKELQRSDWSGPLTSEQIAYAARDAAVLIPLHDALSHKIENAGLSEAAAVENGCVPAIVWMSLAGVPVDAAAWSEICRNLETEAVAMRDEMDRTAPPALTLDLGFGRNWDSPSEVKDALKLAGCSIENTNEETLSDLDHPLANLLRRYRENRKLVSTYGPAWLEHLDGGRVYPDWRQMGASSGRMACSSPNLQQIPRSHGYRGCVAAPPGRVLIKADYSQIELRIAARIAGEEKMLRAYETGSDLHILTAQNVLGKADVSKTDRQLAKAINFGLLYGMGADGFRRYARVQYGLRLTEEEAARYRETFFTTYPALRRWHRSVRNAAARETRTRAGRRRFIDVKTPLPLRLNLPVQGTGADGLKRALGLLWERRSRCPGAVPIIACHDEIVVEAPVAAAVAAADWLRSAMIDGMAPLIQPVPVDVEVQVGKNWEV